MVIADYLIDRMMEKNIISKDDKEIYNYGLNNGTDKFHNSIIYFIHSPKNRYFSVLSCFVYTITFILWRNTL